jgi:hypothetical protein
MERRGKHLCKWGIVRKRCFQWGPPRGYITRNNWRSRLRPWSKMTEKRWQRDSWQLRQRTGLRVPELAVHRRIKIVQLRVESQAVKRRHSVCYSPATSEVCNSVRLLTVPELKPLSRKRIVENVIDSGHWCLQQWTVRRLEVPVAATCVYKVSINPISQTVPRL